MAVTVTHIVAQAAVHGKSSLQRVDYLDGWRGLAILLVLQNHFFTIHGIDTGFFGVEVFFCLSGFLMSHILFVKRTPLATFYKRRISRILPAFLFFVLVIYAISYIKNIHFTWLEFVSTLAFLRTYIPATPDIWHASVPIGHLWSLNVEEHCYIFMSLLTLLAVVRGRESAVLVGAGILAIIIYFVYAKYPGLIGDFADPQIRTETAAANLLLSAGYFLVRERFVKYVRPWMPVVSFFMAATSYADFAPWWYSNLCTPFLLAFTINHLSEVWAPIRQALANPVLRLFGLWSYSIYLWQQPFIHVKGIIGTVPAVAAAIFLGVASFYLLENPVRSWLNRKW